MRILLLNDDFPLAGQGGGATVAANLARAYAQAGHDVSVLTTHQSPEGDWTEEREGYRVTSLGLSYRKSLRPWLSLWNRAASRKVKRFLREHGPFDAAHAHNVHGHLTYASLPLVRRHAKRLILTFHDVMSFSYARLATEKFLRSPPEHPRYRVGLMDHLRQAGITYNPFRNFLIRSSVRKADRRVAVSNALKDALEANGIRVSDVIHNGIDPAAALPSPERMQALSKRFDTAEHPVVFFGGRLSRDKGIVQLLDAYRLLRNDYPSVRILIVGEAERGRALLASYPHREEVEGNLIGTGWLEREDLLAALALCDICVVPSICFDSFPTVNLEAMALGKPVVATCFGGSRELVLEKETGFIINPFDTASLAERLRLLLADPLLRSRMGQAGKERIKNNFTTALQAQRYLHLLG